MTKVFKGATSRTIYLVMVASNGALKTGLAYTAITARYTRTRGSSTSITPATLAAATTAWTSGGWFEVDSTNQKGLYRFDVPDAAFATGADNVIVSVKAGSNVPEQFRAFDLVDWNDQVAAIPNVAAAAVGGLVTAPTTANVALANLVRVDGLTTTDGAAILNLKRLVIANDTADAALSVANSAGDVVLAQASGAGPYHALNLIGAGAGGGLRAWGGATGDGVIVGGGLSISARGTGTAVMIYGPYTTPGPAIWIDATSLQSGVDGGPAIRIDAGDGHGVAITAAGTGKHDVALLGSGDVLSLEISAAGSVSDATPGASGFDGDSGLSSSDDFYNGSVLAFTTGTLKGLARRVTDYTGSTRTFAFAAAFPAAPADDDTFAIFGRID